MAEKYTLDKAVEKFGEDIIFRVLDEIQIKRSPKTNFARLFTAEELRKAGILKPRKRAFDVRITRIRHKGSGSVCKMLVIDSTDGYIMIDAFREAEELDRIARDAGVGVMFA